MEENRITKRVLYMNLETTTLRGRPRNRWQDKVGGGVQKCSWWKRVEEKVTYIMERNGRSS
jgi:hypothetical protein